MKKKFIFAALFGAVFLFSEEVSVFDAGNVNSENPYGLTENEQILLKNIDGLRSVIEGTNKQISNLEQRLSDVEIRATGKSNSNKVSTINKQEITQMQDDIAWIKEQIKIINSKLGNTITQQKKNDVDFKKKKWYTRYRKSDTKLAKYKAKYPKKLRWNFKRSRWVV